MHTTATLPANPPGLDFPDPARRRGMDYRGHVEILRHAHRTEFGQARVSSRQRCARPEGGSAPSIEEAGEDMSLALAGRNGVR
jgi:hypothetical protein